MAGRGTWFLARAAGALLSVTPVAVAAAPVVWTAPALVKIRPSLQPPSGAPTSASIAAARNEFEAFQVVVSGAARDVRASATDLVGPGGYRLCAAAQPGCALNVRLYAEPPINLRRASSSDPESASGAWPDALVPDVDELVNEKRTAFPFQSRARESHAVWVEVFVPADAPAGAYTGLVTVTAAGAKLADVPVALTVWSFTLPSTSPARSAFALAWGALPKAFGIGAAEQDRFSSLRYRFGLLALEHRISLSCIDDGVSYRDLGYYDAYYRPLLDGLGAPPPSVPYGAPPRLLGARMTAVEYLSDKSTQSELDRWSSFFAARGWSPALFEYVCDEPTSGCAWSDIPARASLAHAASPAPLQTLVTTDVQRAQANGVAAAIDVLTPLVNYMDDRSGAYAGNQRATYDAFLASGPRKELWMYQSCMSHDCGGSASWGTGWPSYMIDASAVRNRAMQWMLYRFGASGELYWDTGYALYTYADAWTNQWAYTGNGDGTLFYPGTVAKIGGATEIPVASIRLKMIREGMEDYAYLEILERCGHGAQALSYAAGLFPDAYAAGSVTPERLMSVRAQIAADIVRYGCATAP